METLSDICDMCVCQRETCKMRRQRTWKHSVIYQHTPKRSFHICPSASASLSLVNKEPYISANEPYISARKPCICRICSSVSASLSLVNKEPYNPAKEPYFRKRALSPQKSRMSPQKSPISSQKDPVSFAFASRRLQALLL